MGGWEGKRAILCVWVWVGGWKAGAVGKVNNERINCCLDDALCLCSALLQASPSPVCFSFD